MKKILIFILIAALLIANSGCSNQQQTGTELAENEQEIQQTEGESKADADAVGNVESYYDNQLLPLDQTREDASLEAFIVKLKDVIQKRDIKTFKKMSDPGIKLSFGGDGGVDQLESFWALDTKEGQERFWGELDTVINLGGVLNSDKEIVYPYVFGAFPVEFDSFTYLAVIDDTVELYESADSKSTILRYLNYNIVEYVDTVGSYEAPEFYKIKLTDGTEGFVRGEFCRSPIDYRLGIMKENDEWKIVFLVKGD